MGVGERRSRKVQHPARSRDGCAVGRIWEPERTQCQRWGGIYRETRSFPLPMRRGGPVLGYPAVLTTSSILWGPGQGHFLGGFQVVDSGAGTESWDRSLRTPTCHRGHRQYLSSGPPYDFPRYRSTVHEVTQAFTAASREVLAVEAELTGPRQQPLLASHVRRLQQLEETRLATVALLQLMGTPELTEQEDTMQMDQLKMKVIKTMEEISEVLQDLRFDAESAE